MVDLPVTNRTSNEGTKNTTCYYYTVPCGLMDGRDDKSAVVVVTKVLYKHR